MNTLIAAEHKFKAFWKKAWWSKIIIVIVCYGIFYFLPVLFGGIMLLLVTQEIKSVKLKWFLVVFIVVATLVVGSAWISVLLSPSKIKNDSKATSKPTQTIQAPQAITNTKSVPSQIVTPTNTSTNLKNNDLKRLFNEVDNAKPDDIIFSVDTNTGSIQAHRENESENSWVVIEIMNSWPEIMVEFSLKNTTRDFLYQVYHSGHNIKQAGITINGGSGKYYRVFLGSNQAKTLTDDYWNYLLPSNFYKWIKEVETSRNEEDRANRTFLEESL